MRARLIVLAILVFIALPVSYSLYRHNYAYPQVNVSQGVITNPAVLRNQLPGSVVDTISKTLDNYGNAGSQVHVAYHYTITGDVAVRAGVYTFTVQPSYGGNNIVASVAIYSSAGVPAVSIRLNGQLQPAVE